MEQHTPKQQEIQSDVAQQQKQQKQQKQNSQQNYMEQLKQEKQKQAQQKYQELVKRASPKSHTVRDGIRAFVTGGAICVFGQFLIQSYLSFGLSEDESAICTSITLIGIAALLTGFGIYSKLGKFCGAGTIVPITGFANSVVSPAIEYQKEGMVFGIGAKIFTIAGPVILYGVFTSWVLGLIYWGLQQMNAWPF